MRYLILIILFASCGHYTSNRYRFTDVGVDIVRSRNFEWFGDGVYHALPDSLIFLRIHIGTEIYSDSTRTQIYHPFCDGIDGCEEVITAMDLKLASVLDSIHMAESVARFDSSGFYRYVYDTNHHCFEIVRSLDDVAQRFEKKVICPTFGVDYIIPLSDTIQIRRFGIMLMNERTGTKRVVEVIK